MRPLLVEWKVRNPLLTPNASGCRRCLVEIRVEEITGTLLAALDRFTRSKSAFAFLMAFFVESHLFLSGLPGQFFIQTHRCRVTIHGQIFILDEGERRRVSGEKWQNARDIFSLVSSQQNIQWSEIWFNDACLISISLRSDDTEKKRKKKKQDLELAYHFN